MTDAKTHIGDGVYTDLDIGSGGLILTTEDGYSRTNTIYMGPMEIKNLLDWIENQRQRLPDDS